MGIEEVTAFSSIHPAQSVHDSVNGWLYGESTGEPGPFYNLRKVQELWPHQARCKEDLDQSSVASVDDDVSISDSAHESYSSESSTHTSWTSVSDLADVFSDEDGKDQLLPVKRSQDAPASIEIQTHLLKGLQGVEQQAFDAACPIQSAYRSIKARVSNHLRPAGCDRSQKAAQTSLRTLSHDTSSDSSERRCGSRRSFCVARQCPPKLKRDTDVTEQFVSLLIVFAQRLITAIWPLSNRPPMMSDCFNGAGVLPLNVFIQETLRRSKTSYSTLQVALYYLILLKARMPQDRPKSKVSGESCERSPCRAMQCGRRMFLAALMLASKYLQDRNYSARAWSKISGLRSNEINENEREYLMMIDYDLHVPKDTFDNWSKIVLALSKLSKEEPACRPGSAQTDFQPPANGTGSSLAFMVSQVDLEGLADQNMFSDEWWMALIRKLQPGVVKDTVRVDDFLRSNLPTDKVDITSLATLTKQTTRPWDSPTSGVDAGCSAYDMNFSETLKPRNQDSSKIQTPQTPVQMSPIRAPMQPTRPQLGNLPTPQTTPRIVDSCPWTGSYAKLPLRCSASMDALRSMRRQCIVNANLERCPPPVRQGCNLLLTKSRIRPAETIPELPSRSSTPLTSSPASVASDYTTSTSFTSRSRSSSISSNSSWSSLSSAMPHLRAKVGGEFSSPLARVCSRSDRYGKTSTLECPPRPEMKFQDEGFGGCEEPQTISQQALPISSVADAAHVLMSLSSEPPSQSVTPTPQRIDAQVEGALNPTSESFRGHKRTLSKTEYNLQAQARTAVLDQPMSYDVVVEDPIPPFYDTTPRQWQTPTKTWATTRRAMPNVMDSKRMACSMHQFSSTPNLQMQYLSDAITAS